MEVELSELSHEEVMRILSTSQGQAYADILDSLKHSQGLPVVAVSRESLITLLALVTVNTGQEVQLAGALAFVNEIKRYADEANDTIEVRTIRILLHAMRDYIESDGGDGDLSDIETDSEADARQGNQPDGPVDRRSREQSSEAGASTVIGEDGPDGGFDLVWSRETGTVRPDVPVVPGRGDDSRLREGEQQQSSGVVSYDANGYRYGYPHGEPY